MLTSILSSALFLVSTLMSVSAAPLGEPVIKKRANGKVVRNSTSEGERSG